MTEQIIEHTGVVVKVTDRNYLVAIESEQKCEGCAAAFLCNRDNDNRQLIARNRKMPVLAIGDRISISISSALTWKAILYCIVVPLLLLLAVIVAVSVTTGNDGLASLAGLAAVGLYYFAAYRLSLFTQARYSVTVSKIDRKQK